MTRKSLQVLFCMAAAAVFGAYGTAAQAIAYDVGFDPLDLVGVLQIDVSPSCFTPFPHDNSCAFDVLSVNFTDGLGGAWDISGPEPGIGTSIRVDGNDHLTGIAVSIFDLLPVGFEARCDGTTLSFTLDGAVTFDCGGTSGRSSTATVQTITLVTQVPEPATLALLGVGLGGYALTRRRKRNLELM